MSNNAENKVIFSTPGKFDTDFLKLFGVSAKETANPIGRFGTGLKYAIAILLREKQEIRLFIEDTVYYFYTKKEDKRGKEFEFVWMRAFKDGNDVSNERLPFTTDYGKEWKLWMAFRELYSNTVDEDGIVEITESYPEVGFEQTAFVVTGEEFVKVVREKEDIFLPSKPVNKTEYVDIHEGQTKAVFNRGIKVGEFEKPMLHRYDITGWAYLTEDRQLQSENWFNGQFADSITKSTDGTLIEKIVTAPKEYHESTINFDREVTPSNTFLKTVKGLIKKGRDKINPTVLRLYDTWVQKTRKEQKLNRETFIVKIDRPVGISHRQIAEHIKDALLNWDADFEIDKSNVTVTLQGETEDEIPF